MASDVPIERPLGGSSKLALVMGAGATILLFYLFVATALLVLLFLIAAELVIALILARFGLIRAMTPFLERNFAQLGIFARNLVREKDVQFRSLVEPSEAPRLFEVVNSLAQRAGVPAPEKVFLQVPANAWVELRGLGRASRKTSLGLGYDLLAGLSEAEMESVLAHEITHAKLVRRGYSRWLKNGLGCAGRISQGLFIHQQNQRVSRNRPAFRSLLFSVSDSLTQSCARCVAAYSRQDEFEADQGAAALCGAAPLASALKKLEPLARVTARLPWNERVGQLRMGASFSGWLLEQMNRVQFAPATESEPALLNKYSTHPALRDRLAALGAVKHAGANEVATHALGLLKEPDAAAEKLVREVQKTAAEQERRDSKMLRRWVRKQRSRTSSTWPDLFGLALFVTGFLCGVWALANGFSRAGLVVFGTTLVLTVLFFRLRRYRDPIALPIPDFSLFTAGRTATPLEDGKTLEERFSAQARVLKNRGEKLRFLTNESYAALGECNYLRAYAAARLAMEHRKNRVEVALPLAIASAALNLGEQAARLFQFVRARAGIRSRSVVWGFAWGSLLLHDWSKAEAFLDQSLTACPDDKSLRALLALSQEQRGKLTLAIENARRACEGPDLASAKLLVRLLLTAGEVNESAAVLEPLRGQALEDIDLAFAFIRLNLVLRHEEELQRWVEVFRKISDGPARLVGLGNLFAFARRDEQASNLLREALSAAYFPEAHLTLGRIAAHQHQREEAKEHFLKALDCTRPQCAGSAGVGDILGSVLAELLMLRAPAECRGWIVRLNAGAKPDLLKNRSLLVYAASLSEANAYFNEVLRGALGPTAPPQLPGTVTWTEAPREQQPIVPVRPGVHGIV
jgi:Zn-dependent protease with chaperone function/tetratricopeptide (TPR) repeat protein